MPLQQVKVANQIAKRLWFERWSVWRSSRGWRQLQQQRCSADVVA